MTEQDPLSTVRARIAAAARLTGRDDDAATLIAVSKTRTAEEIEPLLAAGQRAFGENRVQEAQGKWPALRERYPDVELHLVGQ
ncbi:MAG: YggS family pyridoxal phosphate-dependent enzyme, partial [Sphingomonas sp.]